VPDASRGKRHAAIIRGLDIPRPFDLHEFAARLGRQRGRPVRLRPFAFTAGMPCGMWIATAGADYIYYEQATTPFHATAIALHDIAHMLLGHAGSGAWQDLARRVAPDVPASLVSTILGRSGYATQDERDAETLASLMLARATQWPVTWARPGQRA
jgi:hypothetical protein